MRSKATVAFGLLITALSVSACAVASGSRSKVAAGWKSYRSEKLGVSLRYPAAMEVTTGVQATFRGYIPWGAADVRIAYPRSKFERTNISEAAVGIVANRNGLCPPEFTAPTTALLAGKNFYHFRDGDAAGRHSVRAEYFTLSREGRCFVIMTLVQTRRMEDKPMTEGGEKRARQIHESLRDVVETLVLVNGTSGQSE